MSTKISIVAGSAFHLYEELFSHGSEDVFLKIEDPTGIIFERCWENQKESVTVSIPTEVMDRIAGSWIEKRKRDDAAGTSEADKQAWPIEAEEHLNKGKATNNLSNDRTALEPAEIDMRYITCVPGGYLVRKAVLGKPNQRYFSAKNYGGMDQALIAAQEIRDQWVSESKPKPS
ncbi:hypothetical protein KEM63_12180 [Halopseudomonas nanhaiensis]|uniref:hypothetical protein n=1 Tax=Halopseudomonas nanhaiensis TaxID=2830842 RepID=UPI001CBDE7B0|nr:hypothetical protein [Halopseudomonas nanhaiensis]UAW97558.1 hypothetical protein KEM63_12180 [Halopseudomonas nanhaiensis]